MTPAGYEHEAGVLVRAADRAWLERLGLTSLESVFGLEAEVRGKWKALVRLRAPDGSRVFVKRYDYHRGDVWIRGALKLNFAVFSGPKELDNLLALAAAGFRVPVPLAAGEVDEGGRRRSFVALAELAGAPLDALPAPGEANARRERVAQVADLVRRLHAAGFWHRDLYLCNVFWDDDAGLGLLDCERVGHRPDGPRLRWRIKDLAALDYSATWPTRTERLRALLRYLERERLDPATKRLARASHRKAQRIAARGTKGPG